MVKNDDFLPEWMNKKTQKKKFPNKKNLSSLNSEEDSEIESITPDIVERYIIDIPDELADKLVEMFPTTELVDIVKYVIGEYVKDDSSGNRPSD